MNYSFDDSFTEEVKELLAVESIGTINGLLINNDYSDSGKNALIFNLSRAYEFYSKTSKKLSYKTVSLFTETYNNVLLNIDHLKSVLNLNELEFLRRCAKIVSSSLKKKYSSFNKDFSKLFNHLSDIISNGDFDEGITVEVVNTTNEFIIKDSFTKGSVKPLLAAFDYFTLKYNGFSSDSIRLLTLSYKNFLSFAKNTFNKRDLKSFLSYEPKVKNIHETMINEPFNQYF